MKLLLRTIKTTQKYYPFLKILQLAIDKKLPNETAFPNVQKYICAVKDLICHYVLGIRAVFCKVLKSIILFLVSNTPQKLQNR